MKALLLALFLCAAHAVAAERVPPNLLIGLSLTVADVGSAYAGDYDGTSDYAGYFNPRMCYTYTVDERGSRFVPKRGTDDRHACGGDSFSGNMLNWATMSRLDLLRLALTGGDRTTDEATATVLARAWIPDGSPIFARKALAAPASVTPFGGEMLYMTSCRDRIVFSAGKRAITCPSPVKKDYVVAVEACTQADAAGRPGLCHKYGHAFKPEGVLQRYSASMRIGLMSYLLAHGADDPNLYGGVLRAPLKFLGPVGYEAPDFGPVTNTQAEWNAETGVLNPNPDGASSAHSGAINFINQIGRNGLYKAYDPTAELFYEALRYLQARDRSANGSDAGFPVWNTRADPVTAPCQRTMIVTIGHASAVEDRYLPGNERSDHRDAARAADGFAPGRPFNVDLSTDRVGALEGRAGLAKKDDGPLGEGSYYLAGVAYWAHTNAIRPDKPVKVDSFALALDGAPASQGVLGLAAKYGGFVDRNGDGVPVDQEWSAVNPSHYFSGPDLGANIEALFAATAAPSGSVQGKPLAMRAAGRDFLLQTGYEQGSWTGSLKRYEIGATAATWDGASLPPAPRRQIFTVQRNGATAPFKPPLAGIDDALIAFLRGERSREQPAGPLRRRLGLLGDIIHSRPLLVGAPSAAIQAPDYLGFYTRFKNRRPAIYVGANDGMLHAFDALAGTELFAFVPGALLASLGPLSDPGYPHRAYVDGSAGGGEAQLAGQWRTILASGMGKGARGVFAIDISDPSAFGDGKGALWEFTEHDDAAMGSVELPPTLARIKTGRDSFRDFVLVPSGPSLFMLAADKAAGTRWQLGTNYFRLTVPGTEAALGPPGLVLAADGSTRLAYLGDAQGNLWRVDFNAGPPWRNAAGREPLFVARDAAGRRQAITQTPAVALAPGGGYLVLFGTGDASAEIVPSAFSAQSLYAVRDTLARPLVPVRSRAGLVPRTLSGGASFTVRGAEFDYGAKQGWYADFPHAQDDGERSVANPVLEGGALILQTTVPGRDACAAAASRSYVLDAVSGLAYNASGVAASDAVTGHFASGAPVLLLASTTLAQRTPTGSTPVLRTYRFVRPGADAGAVPGPVSVALPAGRLGWREVANWQELHDAAR
ncbi:MAG: PilC/PilY family type IV pilus protein [Pseudomonadota bacterium]